MNINPKIDHLRPTMWQKGQSGNPVGKATGTRDKLGESFLEKMLADFQEHGEQAIAMAREESPLGYVNALVRILPKELNVNSKNDILDKLLDLGEDELASLRNGFELLGSVLSAEESGSNKGNTEAVSTLH